MIETHREAFDFLCGISGEFSPRWKFWRKGASQGSAIQQACACLEDAWPEEVIARLAVVLWHAEGELRESLGPLVLHLATRLAPHFWPKVEEAIRFHWVHPVPLSAADAMPTGPGMMVVAFCHPSGRVREKAVRNSAVLPAAVEVGLLLVRVNDWVPSVRAHASMRLGAAMECLVPRERIPLAPLVARLRQCGRLVNPADVEEWFDRLTDSFDEAAWLGAWGLSRGEERRNYLELLKRANLKPGREIRQALFGSNDRSALLWYIKGVLPRLNEGERSEAIQAIARSRAVPVRKFWLSHRIESDPAKAIAELVEALMHRSRSLRYFARYHLQRLAPRDFAAHYRNALGRPELEAVALRGLTEVAPSEGYQESVRCLSSSSPAIQKAAVESLPQAHLDDHLTRLLEIAGELASGASAAARRRLGEIAPVLGEHLIDNPQQGGELPSGLQVHFVRLAPFFSKWQGLEFLLLQSMKRAMRDDALHAMIVWRRREGRSFVNLKDAHKRRLLAMLAETDLPRELSASLQFTLQRAE